MAGTSDKARGRRVKEQRKAAGLTQAALAQRLSVGYRTVQTWEAGGTIPAPKLPLLAHTLKTTPEYLLGETMDASGDTDLAKRLARVEALAGALADDRVGGEQGARAAGFSELAKRVSELGEDLQRRLDAQAETLQTVLLQLETLRREAQAREAQAQATTDKPEASERTRGTAHRPPRQANH